MIIRSLNLETVCGITSKLPDNQLPEIAFAAVSYTHLTLPTTSRV